MKSRQRILFFSLFFLSGFSILVFELLGSRILAPYVGSSLTTWTAIIGIILASLSLGYYIGGKLSHKNYIWQIFVFTGLSFLYLVFFKDNVLFWVQSVTIFTHTTTILLSSFLLFFPSSFCMALATPFMAKKMIETAPDVGENMGSLYALSTFGSIVGTFLTGFVLIPWLGVTDLLLGLGLLYFFISIFFIKRWYIVVVMGAMSLLVIFFANQIHADVDTVFSQETSYGLLSVVDTQYQGLPVRRLYIDNLVQSQLPIGDAQERLASSYSEYYRLADFLNPKLENTLMIGGGAYVYPQYLLENSPNVSIDVVEINPDITNIAKDYFELEVSDRMNIYHQDARVFLNGTEKKYDAIYIDAFSGFSVPTHLTTIEFIESLYGHLTEHGVVIVNIPGFIEGPEADFIRAEYKTYTSIFDYVNLYPVTYDPEQFQNIMLVAQREISNEPPIWHDDYYDLIQHKWNKPLYTEDIPVLTDDYAPVDFYTRGYSRFY